MTNHKYDKNYKCVRCGCVKEKHDRTYTYNGETKRPNCIIKFNPDGRKEKTSKGNGLAKNGNVLKRGIS